MPDAIFSENDTSIYVLLLWNTSEVHSVRAAVIYEYGCTGKLDKYRWSWNFTTFFFKKYSLQHHVSHIKYILW